MEELTENAEDIAEEGESKQSEQKLGKLQYKVREIMVFWVRKTRNKNFLLSCGLVNTAIGNEDNTIIITQGAR